MDLVTPKPYVAMQSMLNAMEPRWLHRYWKAEFLPGLSSEFLDAFRTSALRVTSPLSQSVIFHLAGALNDHEDDDGAVGNRDAHYIGGVQRHLATRRPRRPAWPGPGWMGADPALLDRRNYVNFQLAEDDSTRTADAYGTNYQRLQRAKATYDPDNLFRMNRNIPPTAVPERPGGRTRAFASLAIGPGPTISRCSGAGPPASSPGASQVHQEPMDDKQVLDRIGALVEEEHALERQATGEGLDEQQQARLHEVEVQLDQCWDLLRQRRARRNAGQDPDNAHVRPEGTVEGYLQ